MSPPDLHQAFATQRPVRISTAALPDHLAIFPGSFNPLHPGHLQIADCATRHLSVPVEFEMSVANVDKPPLELPEVQRRLDQFEAGSSVWITWEPTFLGKAAVLPRCTFVVGADTILRVADGKYYRDRQDRDKSFDQLAENGNRFLVFGRLVQDRFQTLADLHLPAKLRAICDGVTEQEYRRDISSSDLRQS